MKHAGPLFLACGMLLASQAGAAPHGGANQVWIDHSGSVQAMPVDPATGELDWQRLGSSEFDNGAYDPLLTPTLDQFMQSLESGSLDGSQPVPGGAMPYGTAPGPMDPSLAGGGAAGGSYYWWYHDKDNCWDRDCNYCDKDDYNPPPGPIPEPSTLLLAGASALAVGGRRRFRAWRRKNQEDATNG